MRATQERATRRRCGTRCAPPRSYSPDRATHHGPPRAGRDAAAPWPGTCRPMRRKPAPRRAFGSRSVGTATRPRRSSPQGATARRRASSDPPWWRRRRHIRRWRGRLSRHLAKPCGRPSTAPRHLEFPRLSQQQRHEVHVRDATRGVMDEVPGGVVSPMHVVEDPKRRLVASRGLLNRVEERLKQHGGGRRLGPF
jgi:hypothetical protein